MASEFTGRIECRAARPPYRTVAAALWGNAGDIEFRGDFATLGECGWTRLELVRTSTGERVAIRPVATGPLVLEISAASERLLRDASFFLAMECHGRTL